MRLRNNPNANKILEEHSEYGYNFEILHVEDRIVREVRITKCASSGESEVE